MSFCNLCRLFVSTLTFSCSTLQDKYLDDEDEDDDVTNHVVYQQRIRAQQQRHHTRFQLNGSPTNQKAAEELNGAVKRRHGRNQATSARNQATSDVQRGKRREEEQAIG